MSSQDIIELGSSDDDLEPPLKKIKTLPDAMVHIPGKLPGKSISPLNPRKKKIGLNRCSSTTSTINKISSNPFISFKKVCNIPKIKDPLGIDPKIQNKLMKSSTVVKVPQKKPHNAIPQKIQRSQKKNLVIISKIQPTNPKMKLPSSLTAVRKVPIVKSNIEKSILMGTDIPNVINKCLQKGNKNTNNTYINSSEVLSLDSDDDDSNEGQIVFNKTDMQCLESNIELEKQNNREPNKNLIEITIDDSPIKPITCKRAQEIGDELAITIDDSPVKASPKKVVALSGSDEDIKPTTKTPNSKKKLEYPEDEENKDSANENKVHVLDNITQENCQILDKNKHFDDNEADIMEIQDSPVKDSMFLNTSTPKKKSNISPQKNKESSDQNASGEFVSIYQKFIDLCFTIENSDDMHKIVEKKIKSYYRQVPKDYTESEEFIDMVTSKILAIKSCPDKMYLYIKDIVDELNMQRKMAKSQLNVVAIEKKEEKKPSESQCLDEEEETSPHQQKRQRQIHKLEKTLKKLHRAIQKLEEQEVDFDDEEDSVYLLTERYKERLIKVHAKLCQLTSTKMPSEPRIHIDPLPGRPSGPAKKLEKWINKKNPLGSSLPFPDFHDVIRCVREANTEDKLGLIEPDIIDEARDLFVRCGKKLQRRRQENDWRIAASRISLDADPAQSSEDLKKKLDNNRTIAASKESEIFKKFADRQNEMKLLPEEISDKEAEKSPTESGDDDEEEVDEGSSLEDREKRKDRLKRLLQEKSKNAKINDREEINNVEPETIKMKEAEEIVKKDDVNGSKKDDLNVNKVNSELQEVEDKSCNQKEVFDVEKSDQKVSDETLVESEIDELHLLQKLHSENDMRSGSTSSDTGTLVAISDTLESSSDVDNKNKVPCDVISIENSSDSENESRNEDFKNISLEQINQLTPRKYRDKCLKIGNIMEDMEIECSTIGVEKRMSNHNDEYNQSVEEILLASSDEEENIEDAECVNSLDDSLSLGDTVVEDVDDDINSETNLKNIETNIKNNETNLKNNETTDQNVSHQVNISEPIPLPYHVEPKTQQIDTNLNSCEDNNEMNNKTSKEENNLKANSDNFTKDVLSEDEIQNVGSIESISSDSPTFSSDALLNNRVIDNDNNGRSENEENKINSYSKVKGNKEASSEDDIQSAFSVESSTIDSPECLSEAHFSESEKCQVIENISLKSNDNVEINHGAAEHVSIEGSTKNKFKKDLENKQTNIVLVNEEDICHKSIVMNEIESCKLNEFESMDDKDLGIRNDQQIS